MIIQLINDKEQKFKRTLLLPDDITQIIYIVPYGLKQHILNNIVHNRLLPQMRFFTKQFQIKQILSQHTVDGIIFSVDPSAKLAETYKDYKIFFMHHGLIYGFDRLHNIIEKRWSKKFKYIMPKSHLSLPAYITPGLAQFDYIQENRKNMIYMRNMFYRENNIPKHNKLVLVVNGSSNVYDKIQPQSIITTLDEIDIPYTMIIKLKTLDKMSDAFPNAIIADVTKLLYDYFFADVIIVIEGGSALVECIYARPLATIFFMCTEKEIYNIENMPNCSADDVQQLKAHIISRYANEMNTAAIKESKRFIQRVIGSPIKKVSDDIIKHIKAS